MNNIKLYEYYSTSMVDKTYDLYGRIVQIKSVIDWSDEHKVLFIDETGEEDYYIGTMKEIEEDFIPSDKDFIIQEPIAQQPVAQFKTPKIPNKYNIVYYIGTKKVETLDYNLPIVLANGLIKKYKSEILYPQYQTGEIKKELVV